MKVVDGLSSMSLMSSKVKSVYSSAKRRVYTGSDCEWIDLNKIKDNTDCESGDKFVITNKPGVNRRQLLHVDGRTILAFVAKGKKFVECSSFTEVTGQVDCKVGMFHETRIIIN